MIKGGSATYLKSQRNLTKFKWKFSYSTNSFLIPNCKSIQQTSISIQIIIWLQLQVDLTTTFKLIQYISYLIDKLQINSINFYLNAN